MPIPSPATMMGRTESRSIEIYWKQVYREREISHKNQLFLSDFVEHILSNLEQVTVLLWHQLFQEKIIPDLQRQAGSPKKCYCVFFHITLLHMLYSWLHKFQAYPKSWRDTLSNKIQAYTTCDNFPLKTPWLCNAILMYCFCNRVWVPFSRLFNTWQGKVIYMSSAANPIWGLKRKKKKNAERCSNMTESISGF